MNFPPKAISVLLLVQCLFIGMGYALTRRMFSAFETIMSTVERASLYREFYATFYCAKWVAGIGLWALLIPLAWAAWVCLRSESHQSIPMTQAVDTKITLVLTLVTVCFWSYATLQALVMFLRPYGPDLVVSHAG